MEQTLKRLAVLVGIAGAVVAGAVAAYQYYEARSAADAVHIWYENLNTSIAQCGKDRSSIYCEMIANNKKEFEDSVASRDESQGSAQRALGVAVLFPLLSAFLFVGGRWVVTGQAPRFKRLNQ